MSRHNDTPDARKRRRNDFLVRLCGLFCVGLIGLMVVSCGLALAFGNYRLSTIFFSITVGMLLLIKLGTRFLK